MHMLRQTLEDDHAFPGFFSPASDTNERGVRVRQVMCPRPLPHPSQAAHPTIPGETTL
jgi:hypothetical protein